jgi:hypothetical protein
MSRWILAACAVSVVVLTTDSSVRAGSVAATTIGFKAAVARSARIVVGRVTNTAPAVIEGKQFASIELSVEKALKGAPARAGETLRVFDAGQWFQHTHAAAIRGGVVSYEDPRYATAVPARDLTKGATLIFFVRADAAPAAFPPGSAFALCRGAYDRADRAQEVAALNPVAFDAPFKLKVGERALLPDGPEIEVRAHSHKHQMVGGPSKGMSALQLTAGERSELVSVGHVIYPADDGGPPIEEWETLEWGRYRVELVGMSYDVDSTLRVRTK